MYKRHAAYDCQGAEVCAAPHMRSRRHNLFAVYVEWRTVSCNWLLAHIFYATYLNLFIFFFWTLGSPLLARALERRNARTFICSFCSKYAAVVKNRRCASVIWATASHMLRHTVHLYKCKRLCVSECSLGVCNGIRADELAEVALNCLLDCVIVPAGHTLCRLLE